MRVVLDSISRYNNIDKKTGAALRTVRRLADDDAKNYRVFSLDELPELLAFDHAQVLADYKRYRETGQVTPLRNGTNRVAD